ncbi:MAG: hypothetical protein QTN59_07310 [Candidatus Electrothrix communis]|nr:MAG: hypothetical protein QTN59_07310 [Candidatus Electrothrix communis]
MPGLPCALLASPAAYGVLDAILFPSKAEKHSKTSLHLLTG